MFRENCISSKEGMFIKDLRVIKNRDINDMIISGMSKDEVKTIIDNNTYSGLKAKLKPNYWKK